MTTLPPWLRRHAVAVVAAASAWLLSAGAALAAGAAQDDYDPEGNLPFLFAVYTITWVAFFAYAFYVSRRQRELRREIEELRKALEGKDPDRSST